MKKTIILCALLMMVGCGGGKWVQINIDQIHSQWLNKYSKNYKIGETKTAFVGQAIINVAEFAEADKPAFSVSPDEVLSMYTEPRGYHITSGRNNKYPVVGTLNFDNQTFYVTRLSDDWGLLLYANGEIYKKGVYSNPDSMIYLPDIMTITPDNYKFVMLPGIKKGISYEIIYAGKKDESLNTIYREYAPDDRAKPTLILKLTTNEKQIRFKGFVIQIHEVSEEKITYAVLEDGLNNK